MGERTRIVRMILQGKATEHVVVDDEGAAVVDARHIGLQHLDVAAHRVAVLQLEPGLGDACPEQLAYGRIAAGDGPVEVRRHVDNDRILTPGIDVAVDALRIVVEGLLDDASPEIGLRLRAGRSQQGRQQQQAKAHPCAGQEPPPPLRRRSGWVRHSSAPPCRPGRQPPAAAPATRDAAATRRSAPPRTEGASLPIRASGAAYRALYPISLRASYQSMAPDGNAPSR